MWEKIKRRIRLELDGELGEPNQMIILFKINSRLAFINK